MTQSNPENLSGIRDKKARTKLLLIERDFDAIDSWIAEERNPFRLLTSLLFDEDRVIVWRAIEAIGRTAAVYSRKKRGLDKIRRQIQRYFWMMNDESGALCWYGPEAVAETLANTEPLQKDFAMILPSFLVEEPFEAGTRWGMARLIAKIDIPDDINKHYRSFEKVIVDSLQNEEPEIAGKGLLLAQALDLNIPAAVREELAKNNTEVELYDFSSGELAKRKISEFIQ